MNDYAIPESMSEELGLWNNGKGVDIQGWVQCTGNFRLAVGYSTIFWPRFELVRSYIFVEGVSEENIRSFETQEGSTSRSVEAVLNHLHLEDIQHAFCEDVSADKLLHLGNVLIEIYEAKLAWQFPDRPCVVNLYVPENKDDLHDYQITFWQKSHED